MVSPNLTGSESVNNQTPAYGDLYEVMNSQIREPSDNELIRWKLNLNEGVGTIMWSRLRSRFRCMSIEQFLDCGEGTGHACGIECRRFACLAMWRYCMSGCLHSLYGWKSMEKFYFMGDQL